MHGRRFDTACWIAAALVVAVHAGFMARRIAGHSALPYFDQAGYVFKVHGLADLVSGEHGLRAAADPRAVLATPPASRGVLLPLVAAAVLGSEGGVRNIALLWLAVRVLVLLLALAVLARVAGSAHFLPATAAVFLAGPTQLMLNPSLYMMDQSFECFALLAFALVLRDVQVRSTGSATAVGTATLALALVKPAALVFMGPSYAVLMISAARSGAMRARWAVPHLASWTSLLLLAVSPYGAAVSSQYRLGSTGYWWRGYAARELLIWAVLVLPTWLAVLACASLLKHGRRSLPPALLPAAGLTAACWYAFNTLATYTIDPRVIAAAAGVAVSAAALVACRTRALMVAATATGAAVFVLALACASGRASWPYALTFLHVMPQSQRPVPEVGLVPLMARTAEEITRVESGRDPVAVMALINDDFVDPGALSLALGEVPAAKGRTPVAVLPVPWSSDPAHLDCLMQVRWFLTKTVRKTVPLSGDAWTILGALDALVTHADSPLRSRFERRLAHGVRQPDLDDEVVLWRLRQTPTAAQFLAALRWVEPRFRSTPGHPALERRIAGISDALARLPAQPSEGLLFHFDRIERLPRMTRLDGWAFDPSGTGGGPVFLVLQPVSGDPEVFETIPVRRPDVSAHFRRPGLDESGFSLALPHEGLPKASYRLGIYVARPGGGALRLTGESIVID